MVDRTDIVRIFVDIPEQDANYVHGVNLRLHALGEGSSTICRRRAWTWSCWPGCGGLGFRMFDSEGKMIVDTDEGRLTGKGSQLDQLESVIKDSGTGNPPPDCRQHEGVWDKIPGGARMSSRSSRPRSSPRSLCSAVLGSPQDEAQVLVRGYRDEPIEGCVTRTSWALNVKSRTLRAEIDLPNPGAADVSRACMPMPT